MASTSLNRMEAVQSKLSHYQAVPIVGMAVSPVKALISTAQSVAGVAGIILFGLASCCIDNEWLEDKACVAAQHLGMGVRGLASSITNFVTFTLFGCLNEHTAANTKFNATWRNPATQGITMPQANRVKWDAVWVSSKS